MSECCVTSASFDLLSSVKCKKHFRNTLKCDHLSERKVHCPIYKQHILSFLSFTGMSFKALSSCSLNCQRPASNLFVYFWPFQTNNAIFTTNKCEKCPSSIQCWYFNPRPPEHESSPVTTRPFDIASFNELFTITFLDFQSFFQRAKRLKLRRVRTATSTIATTVTMTTIVTTLTMIVMKSLFTQDQSSTKSLKFLLLQVIDSLVDT